MVCMGVAAGAAVTTAFGLLSGPVGLAVAASLGLAGALVDLYDWAIGDQTGRQTQRSPLRLACVAGVVLGAVLVGLMTSEDRENDTADDTASQADEDHPSSSQREPADDEEVEATTSTRPESSEPSTSTMPPPDEEEGGIDGPYGDPVAPLPGDDWDDEEARIYFVDNDCLASPQGQWVEMAWDAEAAEQFCICIYERLSDSGLSFDAVNEVRTSETPDPDAVQEIAEVESAAYVTCTPDP